jgi:hypothetical protein
MKRFRLAGLMTLAANPFVREQGARWRARVLISAARVNRGAPVHFGGIGDAR